MRLVSAELSANQATLTEFAKWLQQFKVYSKANIGLFEGQGYGAVAKEDIQVCNQLRNDQHHSQMKPSKENLFS